MRDVTITELIERLEDGSLQWPPFQFGDGFVYAREDHNDGRRIVVRAPI